jgi:hypothetical protein
MMFKNEQLFPAYQQAARDTHTKRFQVLPRQQSDTDIWGAILMTAGGLHYMLRCGGCFGTIALHEQRLAQAFENRADHTKEIDAVVAVCSRCKLVSSYEIGEDSPNWAGVELLSGTSDWSFLGWLQCGEVFCKVLLPPFAPTNQSISPEEWARAPDSWNWNSLICPFGHMIPKPVPQTRGN